MPSRRWISWMWVMGASVALTLGAWGGNVAAQQGLRVGGNSSHFGERILRGSFMPDPFRVSIVAGGNIDASTLGLGPDCAGYVAREPDFILKYDSPSNFLRVYVTAAGDTTLVINDAAGRWHCNDDSHNSLNPTIDIRQPATTTSGWGATAATASAARCTSPS